MAIRGDSVDWSSVLGPLVRDLDAVEIEELEMATRRYPRRAIRLAAHVTPDQLPFDVEPVPWYSAGFYLRNQDVRPGGFLHYLAGDYYIQDAGSMLALAMSEIAPGESVCDTCASPGGKSTGGLELLAGSGILVSNEVIASRLPILQLALCRTGYSNYVMVNRDVESLAQHMAGKFDCVLVDAPCTGQSMIVRGKQSLAAYSEKQISHSSARQMRILRAAAELVKPGGRMIYSTCTFSFAENEAIVEQLLGEQTDWSVKQFPNLSSFESPGFPGCYRLWPHRDSCAGAFAATLSRSSDAVASVPDSSGARQKTAWSSLTDFPRDKVDWCDVTESSEAGWFQRGAQIHYFDANCRPEMLTLAASGIPMAEEQSGRTEPLYGSGVLSSSVISAKRTIELDDQQAKKFVAGEAIRMAGGTPNGWCNVVWAGRKLAWGKMAGSVLKNHYPKPLRQRNLA